MSTHLTVMRSTSVRTVAWIALHLLVLIGGTVTAEEEPRRLIIDGPVPVAIVSAVASEQAAVLVDVATTVIVRSNDFRLPQNGELPIFSLEIAAGSGGTESLNLDLVTNIDYRLTLATSICPPATGNQDPERVAEELLRTLPNLMLMVDSHSWLKVLHGGVSYLRGVEGFGLLAEATVVRTDLPDYVIDSFNDFLSQREDVIRRRRPGRFVQNIGLVAAAIALGGGSTTVQEIDPTMMWVAVGMLVGGASLAVVGFVWWTSIDDPSIETAADLYNEWYVAHLIEPLFNGN